MRSTFPVFPEASSPRTQVGDIQFQLSLLRIVSLGNPQRHVEELKELIDEQVATHQ